jgi:hypothetical protein
LPGEEGTDGECDFAVMFEDPKKPPVKPVTTLSTPDQSLILTEAAD